MYSALDKGRGVACLKFNVRNYEDVFNALMQNRAFTNSVDPGERPHNAASHQGLRYLPCLAHSW